MRFLSLFLGALVLAACAARAASPALVDQVVLSMGLRGDSNGVIGPQLPHGSINPSPHTPKGGHDGYQPGEPIRGFAQLHVSGTGWGTYGQFLLSPQTGLATGEAEHDSPSAGETATPAYYGVTLTRYGVHAEVTPTRHAAIYRFTYPAQSDATVVFDLAHNIPEHIAPEIGGKFLGGELQIDAARGTLSGWGVYTGGFTSGAPYRVFFYATVDTPIQAAGTWTRKGRQPLPRAAGAGPLGAFLRFGPVSARPVALKIAVSFRNVATARRYLEREIPAFDFDAVRHAAEATWNDALGAIVLEGATPDQRALFYTALYHSLLMPRDRTGDNAAWDSGQPFWDDHYAVWDTWRTKFPLMCIIRPDVVRDNVMAFCDRLEQTGAIGDSIVAGDDGPKQGGDDVDAIIAEAYATGVPGVDWRRAFAVLKHDADEQRYPEYLARGWIPDDGERLMACSNTVECAYNDACAAFVAEALATAGTISGTTPPSTAGNAAPASPATDSASLQADAARWRHRSLQWLNLWNPEMSSDGWKGFLQPRRADGSWVAFDPKQNFGSWHQHFYEANSWTYSLFAPHAFGRLIELCGGPEAFTRRVDHAFTARLVELANEPSFMAARAFNYAGRPDRNAYWTHKVMTELYRLEKGYPGNEDSGAMGSWYVFSALGFFPNAGQGVYLINGPFCPKLTLTMAEGRRLVIEAPDVSPTNIYVQSATLNGHPWTKNWFSYDDIRSGGRLTFVMGPTPGDWGTQPPFAPSFPSAR